MAVSRRLVRSSAMCSPYVWEAATPQIVVVVPSKVYSGGGPTPLAIRSWTDQLRRLREVGSPTQTGHRAQPVCRDFPGFGVSVSVCSASVVDQGSPEPHGICVARASPRLGNTGGSKYIGQRLDHPGDRPGP